MFSLFVCLRSVLYYTKSWWLFVCVVTLSSLTHSRYLIGISMVCFAGVLVMLGSTHRSKGQLILAQSHEDVPFSHLPTPIDFTKRKIP